ncbi:MAG: non-hydrolyzing UDP-N-acetylglucosamine 2-epimerase [Thermaurantimonas sp.]|uniref:non-hydrolyzing UDP-N-acetylglucosamine 2-epimerase n=1 Tax=Thermaurantimonas sp. TaxID=2681568 RepID=UPI003918EAA8
MKNHKILTILGARPQFIKAAAVSRALQRTDLQEIIVHTGQHFDEKMSEVFFREMEIPKPTHRLEIHSLPHGAMTGRMIEGIENILFAEKPSAVMVYGDTNSTLAGALAAVKQHVPVIHVEAGLRSFNMHMPEEVNRVLTDRVSSLLFCPTDTAVQNLKNEGFEHFPIKIVRTGDVMYDAALYYFQKAKHHSTILQILRPEPGKFALATLHRQENTDNPERLKGIVEGLNQINKHTPVVVPLHPRTRKTLENLNYTVNFHIIDPVGYFDMLMLLDSCSIVLTDSGGLQKEAFFFKKPCITLRDETEWVELVEGGYNTLAGWQPHRIQDAFEKSLLYKPDFNKNLYGQGDASEKIASSIQEFLQTA